MFCKFIKSISAGLDGKMNDAAADLMLNLTNENFYDGMKELEKSDPAWLDSTLSSHFVTKFLMEIQQFIFGYFVIASPQS